MKVNERTSVYAPKAWVLLGAFLLIFSSGMDGQELRGLRGRPEVSPDGSQIVFVHAEDVSKDVWEIYVADINGSNVRRLTHFPEARIKKGPVWSPNGEYIVFHADIADGAQLFSIKANGEALKQLTRLPGFNVEPYWSPTGEEIIFNGIADGGKTKMYLMEMEGGQIRELYNPDGENWYPRKTVEDYILFTSDFKQANTYNIFRMKPDGSELQQLTFLKGINWFPEVSPDQTKIVFQSNRDDLELSDSGNYNLYMMNIDGTGLEQITDLPGQELHAKWHPDGQSLIFEWHDQGPKGLYKLILKTGEIQKIDLRYN